MTHHVKATVVGPGMVVMCLSAKCVLKHGFDAMNVMIQTIADMQSLTAAEVLEHYQIIHMSVIRM